MSPPEEPKVAGAWKRPLFIAASLLVFIIAAYVLSYVWWGRGLVAPGVYPSGSGTVPGSGCVGPQAIWEWQCRRGLYQLWAPLRKVEWWWERERVARAFSGTWESWGSGRRVEILLSADGDCRVLSGDYRALNFEREWTDCVEPSIAGAKRNVVIKMPDPNRIFKRVFGATDPRLT